MNNFLLNNQKQEIRFQMGDIILYEPNEEQLEELKKILGENLKVDDNLNASGEIDYKYIRWIIRELCKDGAFVDEYTDDQLEELINNGNRNVRLLVNAIADLLSEIGEDMLLENAQLISTYSQIATILNSNSDKQAMEKKFNKLFKKNGYDVNFEDLGNLTPEMLEKKKIKKSKNK